jgi:hypothetical protein
MPPADGLHRDVLGVAREGGPTEAVPRQFAASMPVYDRLSGVLDVVLFVIGCDASLYARLNIDKYSRGGIASKIRRSSTGVLFTVYSWVSR